MKSMKLGVYEMGTHTYTQTDSDLITTFTIFREQRNLKCEIMISP